LPFVSISEAESVALPNENVHRTATMSADEASHWDALHMGYHIDHVNHSEIHSDHGEHHGVSSQYLHQYASHAAWLEDNRRTDNGTLAKLVVSNAMDSPVS
jgi:hypothetical protein